MDYSKLAQVKVADSATEAAREEKRKKIQDAIDRRRAARERARKLADAKKRREEQRNNRVKDSKKYAIFKVTDSFKSLKKKIKDELLETETTEDAVTACLNALEGQPAEQVLAATVEVLAEAIDAIQEVEPDSDSEEE